MKDNNEYKKNKECAAFDELMIYPFFSSYWGNDELISTFIGEKIEIRRFYPLVMDIAVGKMALALEMEAVSGDDTYYIFMKKIDRSYTFKAIKDLITVSFLTLLDKRDQDKYSKLFFILITDLDMAPDFLVERKNMLEDYGMDGNLTAVCIYPQSTEEGELKDIVLELNNGERGPLLNEDIRDCIKWLNTKEGKRRYKYYWKMIESRWKANLAKELMATGLTEKEIKEALNMNDEEISLFREIKERRENFLSML